ncbi:MAG: glycoside hydrolase family 1 protein [Micrococcales bacterium]|nr:glycoside hydrolase family 1 protein [Micrococcales bacterium]
MRGWHRDGRLHFALGIEDTFVPQGSRRERPIDEYELTEHYERWRDDLELVADSGARLLRWGIPWHRVNPEPGVYDWSFPDRVLGRMTELGIEPIVDLLHYGTPLWLRSEFANPDFPDRFAAYAVAAGERYAGSVSAYTPVNEPMIHAQFCGEYAYWPPRLSGQRGLNRMVRALALGFSRAQRGIREVLGEEVVFVHVDAGFRYAGAVDAPEHREAVERMREQRYLVEDLVTGRVREGHPLLGDLRRSGMTDAELAELTAHPAPPDVMGVNYYPLHSTEVFEPGVHHGGGFADPRPTRDDGTAGLREVLVAYEERYGAPVMLTETAVTGTVAQRADWMRASVDEIGELRAEGHRVIGYTWWPLFDMYEWTWRHSRAPREDHRLTMGLYDLVEGATGLERVANLLAAQFRALAEGSDALAAVPLSAAQGPAARVSGYGEE